MIMPRSVFAVRTEGSSMSPHGYSRARQLVPRFMKIQLLHGGPPCTKASSMQRSTHCTALMKPCLRRSTANDTGCTHVKQHSEDVVFERPRLHIIVQPLCVWITHRSQFHAFSGSVHLAHLTIVVLMSLSSWPKALETEHAPLKTSKQ